jgi:hypothetical protein
MQCGSKLPESTLAKFAGLQAVCGSVRIGKSPRAHELVHHGNPLDCGGEPAIRGTRVGTAMHARQHGAEPLLYHLRITTSPTTPHVIPKASGVLSRIAGDVPG